MRSTTSNAGFTLIEILVVVFIMGVIMGLVGLNFNRGLDSVAHNEAKRYARVLSYTKEYSAYTGRILSLRWDKKKNTYFFLYVDPVKRSWNRLTKTSGNKLLSPHKVNQRVRIKTENRKAHTSENEAVVSDENLQSSSPKSEIALITPFAEFEPDNLILQGETKNYVVTTDEFDDVEIQIQTQ